MKFKHLERLETVLEKLKELNATIKRSADDQIDSAHQKEYEYIQNLIRGENSLVVEYIENNSEEVLEHLKLIPKKRMKTLFQSAQLHLDPFGYESYFDIIEALAVFQSDSQLKSIYDEYITPTIRNSKKGGVTRIIKERQLKSYTLLKNILISENEGCVKFVQENLKQIQKLLLTSVNTKKHNSQITRLT